MAPNGRDAIMACRYNPSQTVFPTIVYRRYSARLAAPDAQPAARLEQRGPDPRPAAPRPRRRPHARALQEPRHALQAPALDALPRRPLQAELRRRLRAGLLGPRRRRQARPDLDLQADRAAATRSASGPTTTTRPRWRSRSTAGCTGCSRSSAATSACPTASSRSSSRRWATSRRIDGRAFVGNTPVFTAFPGQRVQWDVMAMGSEHHTFHVHGHRWRRATARRVDTKTVGPAESFRIRWREQRPRARGSTTATSRPT